MTEFVVFLNSLCIGVLTGIFSEVLYIIKKIFSNNTLVNFAVDFGVTLLGGLALFLYSAKNYYGIFAMFEVVAWIAGIALAKNTCKNLFANFVDMVYNNIIKIGHNFKRSWLGRRVCK